MQFVHISTALTPKRPLAAEISSTKKPFLTKLFLPLHFWILPKLRSHGQPKNYQFVRLITINFIQKYIANDKISENRFCKIMEWKCTNL